MRLVLVKAPKDRQVWAGVPDVFNDRHAHLYPPMGIMQLAAYLRTATEHDIRILDAVPMDWSFEETVQQILKLGKKVVVIYPVPEVGWHAKDYIERALKFEKKIQLPLSTSFDVFKNRNRLTHNQMQKIDPFLSETV